MYKLFLGLIIACVLISPGSASLQELFGTKIYVNSTPTGAGLTFDGELLGKTPMTITGIQIGIHEIQLSLEEYETYRTSVEIGREKKYTIYVTLTPATAGQNKVQVPETAVTSPTTGQSTTYTDYYTTNDLDTTLSGAVVLINPPTIQPTQQPVHADLEGSVKNTIKDKISEGLPVGMETGQNEGPVTPQVKNPFTSTEAGTFSIDSFPSGADVLIDGVKAGTTPLTITSLPVGTHEVSLALDGFDSFSSPVTIKPKSFNQLPQGQTIQLNPKLKSGGSSGLPMKHSIGK